MSDQEFWRLMAAEFENEGEKLYCRDAVLSFLPPVRDVTNPDSILESGEWVLLDAPPEAYQFMGRLVNDCLQRLRLPVGPDLWGAWASALADNEEVHPFAYGPYDLNGNLNPEWGQSDFPSYCVRTRFDFVPESVLLCQRNSRLARTAEEFGTSSRNLDVERINRWMDETGWGNATLGKRLNASPKAISSIRNNGEYHGWPLVQRLARAMGLEFASELFRD